MQHEINLSSLEEKFMNTKIPQNKCNILTIGKLHVNLLFQTAVIILKAYLFFRLSFATFGPVSKILHKRC